ncbi:bacteriohemerythrin [Roseofilum sp. BLCC_M91]|uniref:Bacteriohemerythrin n=1 Tax=Roseofilum halophilum BLCC-M91 TaxID=3022259 RepID=A0ABT7BDZ2_9CYAN|nr:bacteriohemerythrin [Roseofilum halophilum]MDJ1177385.1 bacteriohemerythrin [Roseofilum halophilum BLCC-M91]
MPRTWTDSLKIGIPLLDLQHQQLLDEMDRLLEGLKTKKSSREIKSILKLLDGYVAVHFRYEEGCMNNYQCPVGCDNQKAHQNFVQMLTQIKSEIENHQKFDLVADQVQRNLLDWFVNHIRRIDKQLEPLVKLSKPIAS